MFMKDISIRGGTRDASGDLAAAEGLAHSRLPRGSFVTALETLMKDQGLRGGPRNAPSRHGPHLVPSLRGPLARCGLGR